MPDSASAPQPYTLVYDGGCGVCRRLVGVVERWDGERTIEIATSEAALAAGRFPWIPAEAYTEAMQLIGPRDQTWSGADAVEQLLDVLPRGWLVGWIFRVPLAGRVADRFYRWFARNRHRLGCGVHCGITSPARPAPRSGTSAGSPRGS